MSKQRKVPKYSHQSPPSPAAPRWVAKQPAGEAAEASATKPGMPRAPPAEKEEREETLDDFRHDWPAVPDGESASNLDYYFNSYAHFGIHEDMLKDQVRTGSYKAAILNNKALFEGKTVLDVGSGTGILCLFAAKAGAKRCIGIECSDIADFATEIAQRNGYGDVITYVRGKVEEVELPVERVDIILSEWMGYFLIYESMLDSVLFARDKWLVEGGLMFPDRAKLYVSAIEDADYREEKIGFWDHLWGYDFSPMKRCVMQEPISDTVDASAIATTTSCILDIDLTKVRKDELDFVAPYNLTVTRKDFLHALCVWFDTSFEACSPRVVLSTAPGKPHTHWKQSVLYTEDVLVAEEGDKISGLVAVRKSTANPRDLDVKVSLRHAGEHAGPETVQYYRLR